MGGSQASGQALLCHGKTVVLTGDHHDIVIYIFYRMVSTMVAKLHLLESGLDIDYQSISAEALAEKETESFDVIACLEMLEHVPDPSLVFDACSKLVKPQGNVLSLLHF